MAFNKYQTSIEDLHLEDYPQEVVEEFYDALNSVQYIKNLVSDKRPLMSELPRDEQGRAIIDLANPPIFEDVDYFRQTALKFKRDGKFTDLRPNANPNSEYGKWMKQEVERCWYGMTRQEDGAWVNGDMYFYLNYVPIVQTLIIEGTQMADRIVDFPEFWEGIWWRSIYIEMARKNGRHAAEIAKRGASKSYFVASILAKLFTIGENKNTSKRVRGMVMAYQKEYLVKDGTLNKFEEMKDFLAENTQWPYKTLTSSLDKMQWVMGYKDLETNAKKGTGNEIIGISAKDDPDKGRGKRPQPIDTQIITPNGIKLLGDLNIGDYVYDVHGNPVKVIDIQDYDSGDIYKMTLKDGRVTYAEGDHLFPIIYRSAGKLKQNLRQIKTLANNTRWINGKGETTLKFSLPKNECVKFNKQELPIDPYVLGLYLGDGCYKRGSKNYINLTMLRSDIDSIEKYIPYPIYKSKYRDITHHILINEATNKLDDLGLKEKKSFDKFIPKCYLYNSEENRIKLLNGLLDTDGSCTKDCGVIEYVSKSEQLSSDFLFLCRSLGFNCSRHLKIINGDVYYRCYLYSSDNRLFNLQRKKNNLKRKNPAYEKRCQIDTVEFDRIDKCRCITIDNKDGLYLTNDFIVTHNSSKIIIEEFGNFPKITDTYRVMLPSVQEGDIAFGQMILIGTGGSEGADFAGAMEIIYNPLGYNIQPVQNVYDKAQQGKSQCIFFFSACVNRKGCYNHDGISDITKALLEICHNRYIVKYNTSDPMALTRTKAENPITLQEAIMKRDGSMFPVAQLVDRIDQLKQNHSEYDDVYVGELILKSDGTVGFKPTNDQPIRFFPHNNNKLKGAIEIFEMPQKDQNDKVFSNRYILSCDPYDDDTSQTLSLGSVFVLDLWQDKIVAEYTGRPQFADEFYEIARRMCIFYNGKMNYENNKKGIFAYFKQMNSLYLLTQTFEYLKDRDDTKNQLIGNKAWGTPATEGINYYGRTLLRDWLLKPFTEIHKEGNEDVEVTIPNLMRIRNLALLIELSQWNPDGNFDRVSSMIMMMLYRQDRMIVMGGDLTGKKQQQARKDYIGNDDYFTRNYDNRFNITIQFNESN